MKCFFLAAALGCALWGVTPPQGLSAQTNTSIALNDPVYRLLDVAESRGLCAPLPRVKPYTRAVILKTLAEIENTEAGGRFALRDAEREAVRTARERLTPKPAGFYPALGYYRFAAKEDAALALSADAGFALDAEFSGGLYVQDTRFGSGFEPGFNVWPRFYVKGDVGAHFSYGFSIAGGFMYANRETLGKTYLYYEGYNQHQDPPVTGPDITRNAYTQPRAFMLYSYRPKWDGIVWNIQNINNSDFLVWPQDISVGYGTYSELAGTLLSDAVLLRIGRFEREYGGMRHGYSMDLNAAAQPFLGFDFLVRPFPWLAVSSLTGVLEFDSEYGEKTSPRTFQNAYSISQIELMYKNYIYVGFGSAVVWPKRFELGYMIPLVDKHLYQMNIGDYDNTGEFANIKLSLPGWGSLWGALFLDEINPEAEIFKLDRALFAYQAGLSVNVPLLPFAHITVSYTKIEPYCYTHPAIETPWYSELMEEAFLNHGEPLGYYLKPNSDEIKARFSFLAAHQVSAHVQYQLIRHGAEWGEHQVDGSSYYSELGGERSTDPRYRKNFLQDGAYEWAHIARAGIDWEVKNTALLFFAEAGAVFSYFTDIDEGYGDGNAHPYSVSTEYPTQTALFVSMGVRTLR